MQPLEHSTFTQPPSRGMSFLIILPVALHSVAGFSVVATPRSTGPVAGFSVVATPGSTGPLQVGFAPPLMQLKDKN